MTHLKIARRQHLNGSCKIQEPETLDTVALFIPTTPATCS